MSEQSDDKKEREIEESAECNRDNLRDFVVEAYSHQAQSLSTDGSDSGLDSERMNRFLQRALGESERMSNEVAKSHTRRNELHKELGVEMFENWTQDHAAQVLSPEQYQHWCSEEKQAKEELEKLKEISLQQDESSDDASH